jgi:hypothetical protein
MFEQASTMESVEQALFRVLLLASTVKSTAESGELRIAIQRGLDDFALLSRSATAVAVGSVAGACVFQAGILGSSHVMKLLRISR